MVFDAIVLAGGRSSRLSGTPKAELVYRRQTLVARTVDAASRARRVVVVGDVAVGDVVVGDVVVGDVVTHAATEPLFGRVLLTQEDPPFGGPAAGIAAGAMMLAANGSTADGPAANGPAADGLVASEFTMVLACDMPDVDAAVPILLDALLAALSLEPGTDGVIAIDAELHPQPLAALYRTAKLGEALSRHRRSGTLDGLSARTLISALQLVPVPVPIGSTDDVDTWADAAKYGIREPSLTPAQPLTPTPEGSP